MDAVIRGLAIYFTLLVIIRLSGRRTLAQMTPFDLVIVLVISETTQQATLGDDFSITSAIILILTLFTTDIALSYVKRWWPKTAHVIDGAPTVLVVDGRYDERALRGCRLDEEGCDGGSPQSGRDRARERHQVRDPGGERQHQRDQEAILNTARRNIGN